MDQRIHMAMFFLDTTNSHAFGALKSLCESDRKVVLHFAAYPAGWEELQCKQASVIHGQLNEAELLFVLGRLDFAPLALTSPVCSDGLLVSLTVGTLPLILAVSSPATPQNLFSSAILDYDEVLKEKLTVDVTRSKLADVAGVLMPTEIRWPIQLRGKGLVEHIFTRSITNLQKFVVAVKSSYSSAPSFYPVSSFSYTPLRSTYALRLASGVNKMLTVVLITYELAPGNPGGAGVVIGGIAKELLAGGHKVILVCFLDENSVNMFRATIPPADRERLVVYQFGDLYMGLRVNRDKSEFLYRARWLAHALKALTEKVCAKSMSS